MRTLIAAGAAAGLAASLSAVAVAAAANGTPFNTGVGNAVTLAVYGDAPYGTTPADTSQNELTPAFIDAINADPKVDLVLDVGDIHSGRQFCTEAYDELVAGLWTRYKDPLVYTPGDNEWSDCHKVAQGGGAFNEVTRAGPGAFGPFSWEREIQP